MVGATIFGSTGFMASALGNAKLILAAWSVGALFALAGALGFSAPIAAAALIFASYVGAFFPFFNESNKLFTIGSGSLSLNLGGAQLLASALIAAFTILNCFGVGRVAKIQNALTGFKILVIV